MVAFFVCFWRDSTPPPLWARASSFTRFLDYTQRRTTVGRTPLEDWSARRRDHYLTTHNTHSRRAAVELRLKSLGHWDRQHVGWISKLEGKYMWKFFGPGGGEDWPFIAGFLMLSLLGHVKLLPAFWRHWIPPSFDTPKMESTYLSETWVTNTASCHMNPNRNHCENY
jgi:hypothetical protein